VDEIKISTVFLFMDHNHGDGPPVLFETMVFGSNLDEEQERYCTEDEARAGHARMVQRVLELFPGGTIAFFPSGESR
jgi:hypothetical protein